MIHNLEYNQDNYIRQHRVYRHMPLGTTTTLKAILAIHYYITASFSTAAKYVKSVPLNTITDPIVPDRSSGHINVVCM